MTSSDESTASGSPLTSRSPPRSWKFSTVPDFFIYDAAAAGSSLPAIDGNFGLAPNVTWASLRSKLDELNRAGGGDGSAYKLVYAGRHGEGYHNVAEAYYGTAAWDEHWSKLNGNGTSTWGPDALLTPTGIDQARSVHAAWLAILSRPSEQDRAPLPRSLYSSPMTRSTKTLEITYAGILFDGPNHKDDEKIKGTKRVKPVIKEGFREVYGEHTCDKRRTKSEIHKIVPEFRFEHGFAKDDELWTTERETNDHVDERIQATLAQVWNDDDHDVIGITSHSGVMQSLFRVTGHSRIKPATGAFIPLVIRGTPVDA
ncbi:uncharacterized protein PFL1_06788 [Pseudozyma flocculosa PF-1]|uniref:Phosphoglycerate mutase n=1 Tax=Pseudozyma flocculosa PF-1 TaxID=1277687 RepID=A0A061H4T8_9BASI|nr:uncharacterized protein PFL1_06788 [Pseudozyma flocculosa PF-1]EPQ25651.1 hypothetical protein PFL1_06788 [Pseudozyma flocculosa PF-1]